MSQQMETVLGEYFELILINLYEIIKLSVKMTNNGFLSGPPIICNKTSIFEKRISSSSNIKIYC